MFFICYRHSTIKSIESFSGIVRSEKNSRKFMTPVIIFHNFLIGIINNKKIYYFICGYRVIYSNTDIILVNYGFVMIRYIYSSITADLTTCETIVFSLCCRHIELKTILMLCFLVFVQTAWGKLYFVL